LKPFWRYYGGKWRAVPYYPQPMYSTIIEPFAGAAGYATRYHDRDVVLVEKYPVIAEIWRYLITVTPHEIRSIPINPQHIDDLPAWVPQAAKWLIGFWLNSASTVPCKSLSAGRKRMAASGRVFEGWTSATRDRIATQVQSIRHWRVIEGDYWAVDYNTEATWFVDPPYANDAGSFYVHGCDSLNYAWLSEWCQLLRGQPIVCENDGAQWLPFRPFRTFPAGITGSGKGTPSREAIWP
jgi:hypothetical protein